MRILSAIQPTSAAPHIGNYIGAIKNWKMIIDSDVSRKMMMVKASAANANAPASSKTTVANSQDSNLPLFFIVDLHALTTSLTSQQPSSSPNPNANAKSVRKNTLDMAVSLLGCGINPSKCILFAQSDVKQHSELMWILSCITPVAQLNRMTQYKEKKGSMLGLYSYPVLMAADILLYKATHIPAGEDQVQHIELCRDIIRTYSSACKVDRFKRPNAISFDEISEFLRTQNDPLSPTAAPATPKSMFSGARVLSLRAPENKMSKSDPSPLSKINLTDSKDEIASKIRKAVTDSDVLRLEGLEKRLGVLNLVGIAASLNECPIEKVVADLDGKNMSELKEYVTQVVVDKIVPIGNEIARYGNDIGYVKKVLDEGAGKASEIAESTMQQVRKDVGLSL